MKKPLQILGIVGSPRRGGNTDMLVEETLRGAKDAGAMIEKVFLPELQIGACRACQSCLSTGRCVQRDDMPALLEKMERSDIWVLGSPVYWSSPSAQFKLFLDRWFGQSKIVRFEGRRTIITMPMETNNSEEISQIERNLSGMFTTITDYLKMELFAMIFASSVWEAGKIRAFPEKLAAAYRAGQQAVQQPLKSS